MPAAVVVNTFVRHPISIINLQSHISPHDRILQVSNCHFCSPRLFAPFFGAALLTCARLGSCVCTYACARAAHVFLCTLKSAFWQSLEQYATLWHFRHCLSACSSLSDLPHLLQLSVLGKVDDPSLPGCWSLLSSFAIVAPEGNQKVIDEDSWWRSSIPSSGVFS